MAAGRWRLVSGGEWVVCGGWKVVAGRWWWVDGRQWLVGGGW